jgi:hypothetical protein
VEKHEEAWSIKTALVLPPFPSPILFLSQTSSLPDQVVAVAATRFVSFPWFVS